MKVDLTQSKSIVLSPKQFENIKPSISVTLKDIPIEEVGNTNPLLSDLCDNIFRMEIITQYNEYKKIKNDGLDQYCSDVIKNIEDLISKLDNSVNGLIEISKKSKRDDRF